MPSSPSSAIPTAPSWVPSELLSLGSRAQEMGAFRQKPEQMQLITCSQMTAGGEGRVRPGGRDGGRSRARGAAELGPSPFPRVTPWAVPLTAGEGLMGLSYV